jgi:endonuclease/exonuclease/phosphatase family metal-dependent hydrolase
VKFGALLAGGLCAGALLLAAPPQEPAELKAWPRLDAAAERPNAASAISWEEAGKSVGKTATVRGKVVRAHKTDKVVHLNFTQEWKGTFQVVIFASAWCDFAGPPEDIFLERDILVTGVVKDYKGTPEIVANGPAQLRFADGKGSTGQSAARSSGARVPPPPRAPGVKVATWNLENFFDAWDDPFRSDEQTEPAFVSEPRRQRIADALRLLDADVVCLQEIENRFALEEFVAEYLPDSGYQTVLVEGNDARGIDVALLSRMPVEAVTSYRHRRFRDAAGKEQRFSRDLLRVRIGGALNADVFVVHLKSQQGGDGADVVREAEAREAVAILRAELARDPQWRALIAGDFNEVAGEPTIDIFLQARDAGGAGLTDACLGTDKNSYHQEPYVSRIDFLLLTPALAAELKEATVVDALKGADLRCSSDHFPVAGRFLPR